MDLCLYQSSLLCITVLHTEHTFTSWPGEGADLGRNNRKETPFSHGYRCTIFPRIQSTALGTEELAFLLDYKTAEKVGVAAGDNHPTVWQGREMGEHECWYREGEMKDEAEQG